MIPVDTSPGAMVIGNINAKGYGFTKTGTKWLYVRYWGNNNIQVCRVSDSNIALLQVNNSSDVEDWYQVRADAFDLLDNEALMYNLRVIPIDLRTQEEDLCNDLR